MTKPVQMMKSSPSYLRALPWLEKVWFALFIAVAFLPFLGALTLYRDDWYYMMDGTYGGVSIFHSMFAIDRPLRGYLFEWLFRLFGQNPLPYHFNGLAWRIIAGFGALWLFRLLWPKQRLATWWMAALFALYPGYMWWPGGVEYTPMMISVALQVLSFAFSLAAWKAHHRWQRLVLALVAVFSGWAYLGLVDYAIGMELLRLACFFLMAQPLSPRTKLFFWTILRGWCFYAIVPIGFLLWHNFFFNSIRPDTNLGLQVGKLLQSPVNVGLWWLVRWAQSTFNTAIMAWGEPLGITWQGLRLREVLISLGCGLLGGGLSWMILRFSPSDEESGNDWPKQALAMGCFGVCGGVLPIIMANRSVQFEHYSHYALPASLGAALIVGGLVGLLSSPRLRRSMLIGIAGLAFVIHAAWAQQVIAEEKEIADFWWQISWRAPDFKPGTTFVINYPTIRYGEDQDIVWGPVNDIYFGGKLENEKVHYLFAALPQTHQTTLDVLAGQNRLWEYRSHNAEIRTDQLLVISQPAIGSCVHVIDGEQPWYSVEETEPIILLGPLSRPEMILTEAQPHQPDVVLFGPEPKHDWCYYFQQADLAFQRQNWEQVTFFAEEAAQQNLRPVDRSEWMPFLVAFVILNRQEAIAETATRINDFPYLQQQACTLLRNLPEQGFLLSAEGQTQINKLFCNDSASLK